MSDTAQNTNDENGPQEQREQGRFVEQDLAYLLGRAADALHSGIEPELAAAGLTLLEWKVLAVLHDLPRGQHVTGIAREVRAKHSTIDKLVRRMAKDETVTLESDDGDARRLRVKATAQGKRKAKRLMQLAAAHEQALFAQLPEHITQASIKALLKTLTDDALHMASLRSRDEKPR